MTTNVWLTQVSLIKAPGPSTSITNHFNADHSHLLFYRPSPELGLNHIPSSILPQSGTNWLCNCAVGPLHSSNDEA